MTQAHPGHCVRHSLQLPRPQAVPAPADRVMDIQTLMQGNRQILILHNGGHYCLRITRNGRLILTK